MHISADMDCGKGAGEGSLLKTSVPPLYFRGISPCQGERMEQSLPTGRAFCSLPLYAPCEGVFPLIPSVILQRQTLLFSYN